jgi:conjugal transfer pilus assembly protein TraE
MKSSIFEENFIAMRKQRNFLLVICCLLIFPLILVSSFLFSRAHRIVIVPPIVEKEFWVEPNTVSATYLEQFGSFLGQLLLTKSSYTAETQKKILLKHVDPLYSHTLIERLDKEQELLARDQSSYVFYVTGIEVSSNTYRVLLMGNRIFSVSGKVLSEEKESYVLEFNYRGGRLLLSGLESLAST